MNEATSFQKETENSAWEADALGRKPLADYLTLSIVNQVAAQSAQSARGLTVALDADWGAGKTFFVKEWIKDLTALQHPVVYFDAWENDIGDEASIALMASVLGGLNIWKAKLPVDQAIRTKAIELRNTSIRKLRRAVIPVAGVIAKGLIKKATSIGIDEIVEAFSSEDEGNDSPDNSLDSVLDKVFEEALKDHDSRRGALVAFRQSLTELLKLVCDNAGANLPLFVFVDELDRCRPSYAVKLLEEIKHIFGIEGVAYIVSTNMDQLQSSVRAIYGSDFDGRRYLRRLFDREYALPAADNEKYSAKVFGIGSFIEVRKNLATGLPQKAHVDYSSHAAWALVSDAFSHDFRTQRQVFALASEAASSISEQHPLHLLWLFYLSALYYSKPALLKDIADMRVSSADFRSIIKSSVKHDPSISFFRPTRDSYAHGREESVTLLSDVISKYYELSMMSGREIFMAELRNSYDYPNNLLGIVQSEYGGSFSNHSPMYPTIHNYAKIVRGAGYFVEPHKEP